MSQEDLQKRLKNKVGDKKVALVKEGPICYLVLNDGQNTFNPEKMILIEKVLDEVSKDKEAQMLVTISTNDRFFCTGFDLDFFTNQKDSCVSLLSYTSKVMAKLLTLNVFTIAVCHGHTIAGGFFFALMHDRVIGSSTNKKAYWQLSEFAIGATIPQGFTDLMYTLMKPRFGRLSMWADKFSMEEMLENDVIQQTFKENSEVEMKIQAIQKKNEKIFKNSNVRTNIWYSKEAVHRDLVKGMRN